MDNLIIAKERSVLQVLKMCGLLNSTLTLFLFVALLSVVSTSLFSSPQDILQEKKKQALKVPLVFLCVFEYYKVL